MLRITDENPARTARTQRRRAAPDPSTVTAPLTQLRPVSYGRESNTGVGSLRSARDPSSLDQVHVEVEVIARTRRGRAVVADRSKLLHGLTMGMQIQALSPTDALPPRDRHRLLPTAPCSLDPLRC